MRDFTRKIAAFIVEVWKVCAFVLRKIIKGRS